MEIDNRHISQTVLKIHHTDIVKDIQGDVIMALFEKQVLTEYEYQDIKSEKNREKEACRLLEILPLKGHYGINQFLNYLSIYYSWIADPLQNSITNEFSIMFSKKIQHVLTMGEVPQLPSRHVSRTEHVNKLKELLRTLEMGHFIVVHGMTGCGKSSLVSEVLNDPFITMQYMQGFVQWINVGQENSVDVRSIQTELFNRISDQDQLISPPLNTDYEATRKILRRLWKHKKLNDGLLILDDVYNEEIIKYLDIDCKILITTHDKSIIDTVVDTRVKCIKVNEGFEEKETLDLFSKCLNVDYTSLPSHASKLHNICKGFPLTISLIGAQLETHKEETINNTDRWTFYLEELSDETGDPFKYAPRIQKQVKSLEKTIEMCIKSLPDDLQKNYQDFSVFVCDLNIKPEVLSVLWNLKKIQVEDILSELIHKNLVVRAWNQPLNSYVYSIHDLLLSNLKKMTIYQSKDLHKKLIEHYRIYCNGNFAELPKNDNYIFLYFGYHLKNADMLEEFPKWFLNLKFLESKIYVTGPADLLADLQKYRKYIAIQSVYEKYIKEIEYFVQCNGPNLYQTKCDIVQLGLQESESSFIYNESYKIAKQSEKSYFYFNIRASQNCVPEPFISIVRDKIETVIFGNRHDEVIIATTSGSIKIWNIISHKCLYIYNGHTAKVNHLVKNKLKDRFLSTSDDSTIRIWNMNSFPETNNSETRTPSPETRQEHWQNVFHQNYKRPTDITDCLFILNGHSGPVIFAQFSSNGRLVVSSSTDKTLKIWKLKDGTLHKSINQTSIIYECYFMETTTHDRIVFSTRSQTGSVIYGCQWPFDHCNGLLYLKEKLLSFFPLPSIDGNDKLLILTPNKVGRYEFNWDAFFRLMEYPHPITYQHCKLFSISDDYTSKIDKSRYIAFSLSNCTIKICELSTGYNFLDLNDPVQGILKLDWFWSKLNQSNWLLCAAEDKSIRLWCLNDITQYTCAHRTNTILQPNNHFENICKNEIISLQNYKLFTEKQNLYCYKLKENFDAVWLNNNCILVAAITKCGTLKILYEGLDQWSMIDNKVSALSIVYSDQTLNETMIIVACEDFSVHMLKYQTSQYLFNTLNKVDQIYACFTHGHLTMALLIKNDVKITNQRIEIWANGKKLQVDIQKFIDCYVFYNKVILIHNIHEMMIIDVSTETIVKLEINCIKVNGSLMLDNSTLAVTNNGNTLNIFKLTSNSTLNLIDQYDELPFKENEFISISMSNDKNLIVVGGQNNIVLIDTISKTTKRFITGPYVNNIQSIIWSSDDTHLAIKEDNQIITFNVESGKKIASVRLTVHTFFVDSMLKTYITINTAGQLVMLTLSSDIDS